MKTNDEIIYFNFPKDMGDEIDKLVGNDKKKAWVLAMLVGKILKRYKDGKLQII